MIQRQMQFGWFLGGLVTERCKMSDTDVAVERKK